MKRPPRVCPVGHRYYNRGECQHCRAIKDKAVNEYFKRESERILREANHST